MGRDGIGVAIALGGRYQPDAVQILDAGPRAFARRGLGIVHAQMLARDKSHARAFQGALKPAAIGRDHAHRPVVALGFVLWLQARARVQLGHDVIAFGRFVPGAMVARLVVIGQPGGPVFFALLLDHLGACNDRIAPPSQMGLRRPLQGLQGFGQLAAAAAPLPA